MSRLSIDISAIPFEGVSHLFTTDKKGLDIDDPELRVVQPLQIACAFHRIDREVVVRGNMRSAVCLTCGRCAEEFVLPLSIALDAIYMPMHEASSERVQELEDGLTDVYTYSEQAIDLAEMVRDKLLLSIPLQPHCTATCRGVCPACGVNRNTITCQCAEVRLGSPFELLKGLRFS
jgi:uncharacterized protein